MAITKLEQMFDLLKSKPKKRISVAFANDPHTIEAVYSAVEKGILERCAYTRRSERNEP